MAQEPPSALLTPRVSFARHEVQPPAELYLSAETILFAQLFNAFTGATVVTIGRLLHLNGQVVPFFQETRPVADRSSVDQRVITNAEGFLLGVRLGVREAVRTGQLYGRLGLSYGTVGSVDVAELAAGKISSQRALNYPPGGTEGAVEGAGILRSITGTDPAAGAEISETVPTNARWRLIALRATLVTDATAGARVVHLFFDDGAAVYLECVAASSHNPSLTRQYSAAAYGVSPATLNTEVLIPSPPQLYLLQGHRLRTSTNSLAAGDNWGAPQLLVEEWIED